MKKLATITKIRTSIAILLALTLCIQPLNVFADTKTKNATKAVSIQNTADDISSYKLILDYYVTASGYLVKLAEELGELNDVSDSLSTLESYIKEYKKDFLDDDIPSASFKTIHTNLESAFNHLLLCIQELESAEKNLKEGDSLESFEQYMTSATNDFDKSIQYFTIARDELENKSVDESITSTYAPTPQLISVTVAGEKISFDQPPVLVNDRVLVPIRFVVEKMGCKVEWDADTQTVYINDETIPVKRNATKSGNINVFANNRKIEFTDQQPINRNGRVLIPVRFVTEALGYNVTWDTDNQIVKINAMYTNTPQSEKTPVPTSTPTSDLTGIVCYSEFPTVPDFDPFNLAISKKIDKDGDWTTYNYELDMIPIETTLRYYDKLESAGFSYYELDDITPSTYSNGKLIVYIGYIDDTHLAVHIKHMK